MPGILSRVLITTAFVAFAVVATQSGADRLSARQPLVERLVFAPFRAEANRAAARLALSRGDNTRALTFARTAVTNDPIDPDSAALLGSALFLDGDGAARAFRIAARFGWQNMATQWYWMEAALGAGDYRVAVERADAILRIQRARLRVNDLLGPIEQVPEGRKALAERLRRSPPWLDAYFRPATEAPAGLYEQRIKTVRLANEAGHRFECETIAPLITVLLRLGGYDQAVALWNRNCPQRAVSDGNAIGDFGRLNLEPDNPFAWRPFKSGDVSVGVEGRGEDAVLTATNHAPSTRRLMDKPVRLAPGIYRIRAQGGADSGKGFGLTMGCDGQPRRPRPRQLDLSGQGQILEVGPCSSQALSFWLAPTERAARIGAVQLTKMD